MSIQNSKTELKSLMLGEAIGTTARFAVDWYAVRFIVFPIILVLLVVITLIFGVVGGAVGLVALVAMCFFWILWAAVSSFSEAFAPCPDELLRPAIEKRFPGMSRHFFDKMYEQSNCDLVLREHAERFRTNSEEYLKELAPSMEWLALRVYQKQEQENS